MTSVLVKKIWCFVFQSINYTEIIDKFAHLNVRRKVIWINSYFLRNEFLKRIIMLWVSKNPVTTELLFLYEFTHLYSTKSKFIWGQKIFFFRVHRPSKIFFYITRLRWSLLFYLVNFVQYGILVSDLANAKRKCKKFCGSTESQNFLP